MRKKILEGNVISLTEKEWKQIRNRFDHTKFIKHRNNFASHIECPICIRYKYEAVTIDECCNKCPLEIKYGGENKERGCIYVINTVLNGDEIEFGITVNSITFSEYYSYEAIRQLEKIVKWLDSFDKKIKGEAIEGFYD